MNKEFDPQSNYEESKKAIGYVNFEKAIQKDYDRIGFKAGLEIHQQLKSKRKLFCYCPAGIYHYNDDFNAEIIRHMRPTLSELGEYDGTALMELKTKKEITYRINNKTACTYEIDDTPPFPIDREALEIALEITLLSKMNVVGEVHIARKQYLDGSIPTGFQRTAILGVEGEIQLRNKKVRLIQLSIEEDACREISDIGHKRIYKTDRLGMPLIETVTYPDFVNPEEVKEGANYIRFLNRSTGKVRTGMGAAREDVNVSCRGGTRVEIKGVSHNNWIPRLTHNEAFRQWALLRIKKILNQRVKNTKHRKINYKQIKSNEIFTTYEPLKIAKTNKYEVVAVNLPDFKGILSHFTQPGKIFADEISDRLKVVACLEKPNMIHSEQYKLKINLSDFEKITDILNAKKNDAQLLIWGPKEDIETALETIEDRCQIAFERVPNETRKSFENGTTIFERVLPGADRMYPDTDSAAISLDDDYINKLSENLPVDVYRRIEQLKNWNVPEDTYTYILKRNIMPIIENIINDLKINPKFVGTFFGHTLKWVEGKYNPSREFNYNKIYELFEYLKENNIELNIAKKMLPELYQNAQLDIESILKIIKFKRKTKEKILAMIPFLRKKFEEIKISKNSNVESNWMMGKLINDAIGNIPLKNLKTEIEKIN
ncbi:MAG: Glu-tRNA(Gln) amidotransferase subunit GatE [Candidatus Cloacimonetes bacterium]|nr:Glu-tRNA(Gln) amidotransferase subunit GatE [Candidatus Cloacimonadota bacterium]